MCNTELNESIRVTTFNYIIFFTRKEYMEIYHTLEAGWTKTCQMLHFVPLMDLMPPHSPIMATAWQGDTWKAAPAPPAAASVPAVRARQAAA